MSFRFIHIVAGVSICFLLKADEYLIVCIHHILFIHSYVNEHLDCFHHLAIVNNAAMSVGLQISLWDPAFLFLFCIPRSRIAGSDVNFIFNFLRICHNDFHGGSTILHSYPQCTGVPLSPHSCQHLLFFFFW